MTEEIREPTEVQETPPKEEPIAPTREEFEQLRSQLQQSEGNWKDTQRVVSKKDLELQELRNRLADKEDTFELYKATIGALAERRGVTEEEVETDIRNRKPDYIGQLDQIERRSEIKRKQRELGAKAQSYQEIAEKELGLKETDPGYRVIRALVVSGDYEGADRAIEAAKAQKEAQAKTPPPKKELSEEDEEAIARKYMDKHGYSKQETGSPSASSGKGFKQAEQDYADGKISTAEYTQAMKDYKKI